MNRPTDFDYRIDMDKGKIGLNDSGALVEIGFQGVGSGHDRRRYQRIPMTRQEFDRLVDMVRMIKEWS